VGEGPFRVTTILRDHADTVALERAQEQMILEAVEGLRSKNPHEILGLSQNPPREAVERAYEEAKERFSRERLIPRVRERLRSEVALIEGRLIESYLTLSQVRGSDAPRLDDGGPLPKEPATKDDLLVRVELDKTRSKLAMEENSKVADQYYLKARKFVREGDYYNAIQYAKLAISYAPEDARFYFLLGECQAKNPEARWQRMAEQSFVKAAELDPWNAEYRVGLGRFYKRRGLKLRAKRQFEEALTVVPDHAAALEELKTLD
jgi:tetratricopeptide (TPR) repeat protein